MLCNNNHSCLEGHRASSYYPLVKGCGTRSSAAGLLKPQAPCKLHCRLSLQNRNFALAELDCAAATMHARSPSSPHLPRQEGVQEQHLESWRLLPQSLQVTVISTSPGKKEEALQRLGATSFLVSKDEEAMKAAAGTLDGIIDTVSGGYCRGTTLNDGY